MSDVNVLTGEQHHVSSLICNRGSVLICILFLPILCSLKVLPGLIEDSVNLIYECRDRRHLAWVILLLRAPNAVTYLTVGTSC